MATASNRERLFPSINFNSGEEILSFIKFDTKSGSTHIQIKTNRKTFSKYYGPGDGSYENDIKELQQMIRENKSWIPRFL